MNDYELKVFMSSLPSPWPVKQSDMPCGAQDLNTRMISLQSNSSQRDTGLTMTPQQASDPSGENVSAMLPMLPMLHENPNYERAPEKRSNPALVAGHEKGQTTYQSILHTYMSDHVS